MSIVVPRLGTALLSMPKLGLGTWKMSGPEGQAAVESALELGYRHIDTAEMYGNEREVGAALKASGVPREEVFLTSKVWHDHLEPEAMRAALAGSLDRLGSPYLDLYLIHWPAPSMDLGRSLHALDQLREEGRVRAVGVSNFPPGMLRRALGVGVPLACVQVEYHLGLSQDRLLTVAREAGMVLTAYSPLGRGELPEDPVLGAIARKHGASPAQAALAWLLRQDGVAAIPKAARESSQRLNLEAVSLSARLDAEDVASIDALPKGRRLVSPSFAPNWDD